MASVARISSAALDAEVLRLKDKYGAKSSLDMYEILAVREGKNVSLSDVMDAWARVSQKAIGSVTQVSLAELPQVSFASPEPVNLSSPGDQDVVGHLIDGLLKKDRFKDYRSVEHIIYRCEKGELHIDPEALQIAKDFLKMKDIEGSISYATSYLGDDRFIPDK